MNGTLSFNAPSLGTVIVFEDSYNTTVLWMTVAAVVIFIIMLFVAERWQYRNAKRKADEEARKRREAKKNNGYEW
jgi:heme/copper-type cytochrome/quinol oxidase subunit 2